MPILIGSASLVDKNEIGVSVVIDISERKRAEEQLAYMATHDALTRLPNRSRCHSAE